MADPEFRYWAFISYSHADKAWGDWLHHALETYRVPGRLVGRPGRDGPVPARLFPIFRDREELPSSADLGNNIGEALRQSRFLVVICSPKAAVSRWVNEEIASFKRLGRESRILALIVDGEPNATDHPDSGELECFPKALRHRVGADGALLPDRVEPIAADARSQRDGRNNARLKLLAGLIGVPYDDLRQREKQRRTRQRIQWAAAAAVLVGLVAGAWNWETQRRATQAAIAAYTEQGRQLFLDDKPLQAAVVLGEAYGLGGRSPTLRFLLARSMLYVRALRQTIHAPGLWLNGNVSPDGRRVVIASGDRFADVWDLASGRRLYSLARPDAGTQLGAEFSPDGTHVAVISKPAMLEKTTLIRVFDTADGRERVTLKFDNAMSAHWSFSRDGKRLLAWGDAEDVAEVLDPASATYVAIIKDHGQRIDRALLSPDGRMVVTVSNDRTIGLWDGTTGTRRATLNEPGGTIKDLAISPDGATLASAHEDGTARTWDLRAGRPLRSIAAAEMGDGSHGSVEVVKFSQDGKQLVTAATNKSVQVWDPATGRNLASLEHLPDEPRRLSLTADGRWLAVSMKNHATWLWDGQARVIRATVPADRALFTPDGRQLVTFSGRDNLAQVWDVAALAAAVVPLTGSYSAFDPAESRVATLEGGAVRIWNARTGALLHVLDLAADPAGAGDSPLATSAAFSPDGDTLLAAAFSGDAPTLWDVSSGRKVGRLDGHSKQQEVAYAPDGSRIFACTPEDGIAELWDAHERRLLASFTIPDGCIRNVRFGRDGSQVAGTRAIRGDRTFRHLAEAWDLTTRTRALAPPESLRASGSGVAYAEGGKLLVTADDAGIVRVRDSATGRLVRSWDSKSGTIEALAVDPGGRRLATGHENGTLNVWDIGGGEPLWRQKGETLGVGGLSWRPDGNQLVSQRAFGETASSVWDAATGELLMRIVGDSKATETLVFSSAGNYIASNAYDEPARLLDTRLEDDPPAAVAALIRCRVPWRLEAGQVTTAAPDSTACVNP